jgi:hypothetical protein
MTMVASSASYPVRLEVTRPESQSRLTNFPLFIGTFIRGILVIPHAIILYFLELIAALLYFIASFAILFSGVYPRGMYNFVAGYMRWYGNYTGYLFHLYDTYPPFSSDPRDYPLSFDVEYPEASSKLLNLPLLYFIFRFVLLIPHIVVVALLSLAAFVVIFIAQFAILFSGAFPVGMHGFVVGVIRWTMRINSYFLGLTDRYPPFSLS